MSPVNDHSSYSASESNSSESSSDEEALALIKDDSNLVNDIQPLSQTADGAKTGDQIENYKNRLRNIINEVKSDFENDLDDYVEIKVERPLSSLSDTDKINAEIPTNDVRPVAVESADSNQMIILIVIQVTMALHVIQIMGHSEDRKTPLDKARERPEEGHREVTSILQSPGEWMASVGRVDTDG
ncbi:unnamed protein product [Diamesa serratosioi]